MCPREEMGEENFRLSEKKKKKKKPEFLDIRLACG